VLAALLAVEADAPAIIDAGDQGAGTIDARVSVVDIDVGDQEGLIDMGDSRGRYRRGRLGCSIDTGDQEGLADASSHRRGRPGQGAR